MRAESRLDEIENQLALQDALDPVHGIYMAALEAYHLERGDHRSAERLAYEKMLLGDSYAEVLGRHDRAMELYFAALELTPESSVLLDRIEKSRRRIYASQSDFARVRIGMRETDVHEILGYPRVSWVRQTVRRGRVFTAWIYPRKGGGAAAIYFDEGIVYHKNWSASDP